MRPAGARRALIAAMLSILAGAARASCPLPPDHPNHLAQGPVALQWEASPATPAVGQAFELVVTVCPQPASLKGVAATMPLHRHGMNYRPTLASLGDGRWRVQGLLWHMSGQWELAFQIEPGGGGAPRVLRQSVWLR